MRTEPRSTLDTFSLNGKPAGFTVGDFWQWGMSDLAINIIRAAVAEFLVSKALGCTAKVRNCWGGCDLVSPEGIKIEVKSSAYWQAWKQEQPSSVRFGIGPARDWCAETNVMAAEAKRNADLYVFCLINNLENKEADLLEISNWEFFVLAGAKLNEACPKQKSISLKSLLRLNPTKADFKALKETVSQLGTSPAPSHDLNQTNNNLFN